MWSRSVAALALPLSLVITACGSEKASSQRVIAAGFYPLAYAATQVAGPDWEVENLTDAGSEPHDLELGIAETASLSDASLVLYAAGFQPAVDAAVDQNASGATLDAAAEVELQPANGSDELDPHFWHDPLNMAEVADSVATQLAEIDPAGAQEYRSRADDFAASMEQLDTEFAESLAACEQSTVVVNHDAFGYLEKYGLTIEPILGLSPDAEATPAELDDISQTIEDSGVEVLFAERLSSSKTVDALAGDLGLEVEVLDPIEGLSDQTDGEDYASLMRANLAALTTSSIC